MNGFFLTFEGIDGCGKSTQIELTSQWLRERGREVLVVREPGGTVLGEQLRDVLLAPETGDIAPSAEALLYAASRAELVDKVIKPALNKGVVVIADRFVDSSLAYQGAGRELGVARVFGANDLALSDLWPDMTFVLDIPYDEAVRRRSGEAEDRIEAQPSEFHERVVAAYDMLIRSDAQGRLVRIDATGAIEDVWDEVVAQLEAETALAASSEVQA